LLQVFFKRHRYVRLVNRLLMALFVCFAITRTAGGAPAGEGAAEDSTKTGTSEVTASGIRFTWLWAATQFAPSPQWSIPESGSSTFGFRWQLTPLLYSWGMNRRVSPWRSFVVEPLTRNNGSAELFLSPEYLPLPGSETQWLWRGGIRATFPLVEYGDYLSGSLATSYYRFGSESGVSYEAGLYMFFGILGAQVTWSPDLTIAPWTFTIRIRYF